MSRAKLSNLKERLKTSIKNRNLKQTTQRETILETLFEAGGHRTPEELHKLILDKNPSSNIGMATIYRTLNFFEQEGLANGVPFKEGGKKFELNTKQHHDHIVCTECDDIVEFENDKIEKLQKEIAKKYGFEMLFHVMQLYGVCEKCQKSKLEIRK